MSQSQPRHGDERGRRIETVVTPSLGRTPDGATVELGSSLTRTVSEKYCATCNAWILVKGVTGALEFMFEHEEGHAPREG